MSRQNNKLQAASYNTIACFIYVECKRPRPKLWRGGCEEKPDKPRIRVVACRASPADLAHLIDVMGDGNYLAIGVFQFHVPFEVAFTHLFRGLFDA